MKQYRELCERVLSEGLKTDDRTGTGTLSVFGHQSVYDLREGFPLLTLKKTHWKSVVHELLWFLSGDTNIRYLKDNGVRIWDEWCNAYKNGYKEFKGKDAVAAAYEDGDRLGLDLGNVYGAQWRSFGEVNGLLSGIDQVKKLLDEAIQNPTSRRLIVSAWNPLDIPEMALPPCHTMWQVKLTPTDETNKEYFIDLQLYQRSGDIFLGIPFNIASYSLLLMMISYHINKFAEFKTTPRNFIHTIGDAHIYSNHIEQTKEMLQREEKPLPAVEIEYADDIFDIKFDNIKLIDYDAHPVIKAPVAV